MNFTGNIKKEVEKKCEFEDALNLTGKHSTRFFFKIWKDGSYFTTLMIKNPRNSFSTSRNKIIGR